MDSKTIQKNIGPDEVLAIHDSKLDTYQPYLPDEMSICVKRTIKLVKLKQGHPAYEQIVNAYKDRLKKREKTSHDEKTIVVDLIAILDKSGSMEVMGNEPFQAINAFVKEQLNNCDDGSTFSLAMFSNTAKTLIMDVPIKDFTPLTEKDYNPGGCTALNDAVCETIDKVLASKKPKHKVLLIMTDGEENSSRKFSTKDTRKKIELVESKYDWKVIYMGANVDAFHECSKMNINHNRCSSYDQLVPGALLQLCRSTSEAVHDFRRARTDGLDVDLMVPRPSPLNHTVTEPISRKDKQIAAMGTLRKNMKPIPLQRANAMVIGETQLLFHDILPPPTLSRQLTRN